ncbi:MAG TPA: mechanosensitive ion channel domain-containing protein [Vicinamibacterales bacterium]|jgi:small-conductance mechanosensitive channel
MTNSLLVLRSSGRMARMIVAALMTLTSAVVVVSGQPTQSAQPPAGNRSLDDVLEQAAAQAQRDAAPARLVYHNRFITEFRASILRRLPEDRVNGARQALDRIVRDAGAMSVSLRTGDNFVIYTIGNRDVFALVTADVDELAGETLAQQAADTRARLEIALAEALESRTPARLLVSGLQALGVTFLFGVLIWVLVRFRRSTGRRIEEEARRRLEASGETAREFVQSSHLLDWVKGAMTFVVVAVGLVFTYVWLTSVLRRFPYSRPWGESLRGFLVDQLLFVSRAMVNAAPRLFTVLLIAVLTRFVVRLINLFFVAVERGRISIPWIYPETLQPTRRLFVAGLWLFALALAFPFLPGSESEAFKGISVLLGLMVTLGSSGLVNQVMSGFTLTYSRALRVKDFVKVNQIEGTVTQIGPLSTKIRTPWGEEVTIPNAVIVSHTVTNYTRFAETDGVFVPTSISIGYDVPWRQVHSLLIQAASRTPGVRAQPPPVVREAELGDFSVKYILLVSLERPQQRFAILAAVHANILDLFNEHGVQIMSPAYEADPAAPKIVPRDRWFAAPADVESTGETLSADPTR